MDRRSPRRLVSWLLSACLAALLAGGGCIFTASPGEVQEESSGEADAETTDGGTEREDTTDGGVADASDGGAVDATDASECEPESPEEICERIGAECGQVTAKDKCDNERTVECGSDCPEGQTCGAAEPNKCACPCEFEGKCLQSGESPEGRPCLTCRDTELTQVEHGTACGNEGVCLDGRCMCEGGYSKYCESASDCIDIRTNPYHCGDCDLTCSDEQVCEGGECLDGCNNLTKCAGRCVDTETNDGHCGDCGVNCQECETCSERECERRFDRRKAGESCQHDCACISGSCRGGTCAHRMFVTSGTTPPDLAGTASGPALEQMDSICESHAVNANLDGGWRAVASKEMNDAKTRLSVSGPVENMNGDKIADNKRDLWDGTLTNPVMYDESSMELRGTVWSGTNSDGTATTGGGGSAGSLRCGEWTDDSIALSAMTGRSGRTNSGWIAITEQNCDTQYHLYCIDGQQ